jgi:transcriptional regulator with XRE-family HTH domain
MQNINVNATIERIRLLRRQHAGERGKSKFARALGISPSTYSYYEDNRIPPVEILLKICEVTGADLQWLLTGQSAGKSFAFGENFGPMQKLNDLFANNPEMTGAVLAFIELLCEKKGIEKKFHIAETVTLKPERPGWIPVLGRTAAGIIHFWDQTLLPEPKQAITELDELVTKHIGKAIIGSTNGTVSIDFQARPLVENLKNRQVNIIKLAGLEEEQIVEFVQCEDIHNLFPDSFALQIDGDSMSPRINDGDIVILSPSVPAAQGQIGIVRIANQIGVTCKLLRTTENETHLIPINERYEPKVVSKKDLLWALAVLCHIRV